MGRGIGETNYRFSVCRKFLTCFLCCRFSLSLSLFLLYICLFLTLSLSLSFSAIVILAVEFPYLNFLYFHTYVLRVLHASKPGKRRDASSSYNHRINSVLGLFSMRSRVAFANATQDITTCRLFQRRPPLQIGLSSLACETRSSLAVQRCNIPRYPLITVDLRGASIFLPLASREFLRASVGGTKETRAFCVSLGYPISCRVVIRYPAVTPVTSVT